MELVSLLSIEVGKLFLMMIVGFIVYRTRLLTAQESRVISKLLIYLVLPCVVLNSFLVECTPDKLRGLGLAYAAAAVVTLGTIDFTMLLGRPLKLTPLEQVSIIYCNTGIVVPIVTAVLGREYVLYSTGMLFVHTILMWTHCKIVVSGEKTIHWKKILLNSNLIGMVIGFFLLLSQIQLPRVVSSTVEGFAALFGPLSMLVTGMLVGSIKWERLRSFKRLPLVVALRMIGAPLFAVLLLGLTRAYQLVPDGQNILTIVILAVATNSASVITQMTQLYGGDSEYSSIICAVTSVLSIAALPVFSALFALICG